MPSAEISQKLQLQECDICIFFEKSQSLNSEIILNYQELQITRKFPEMQKFFLLINSFQKILIYKREEVIFQKIDLVKIAEMFERRKCLVEGLWCLQNQVSSAAFSLARYSTSPPVCPLGCEVHAKEMYCIIWRHT